MPNVAFVREELKKLLPQYEVIRDCVAGEKQVKGRRSKYLPIPNAADKSDDNVARYSAYLERAVFYNVTQRTLIGLTGQVFAKNPVVKVPAILKIVNVDANGGGITLTQLAKRGVMQVLSLGRGGVFTDYPTTDGAATQAQLESGDIRPTINIYSPEQIINWRTKTRGAKEILSLVVLEEKYVSSDDGFEMKQDKQWRVLRLTEEDKYEVTIYRKMGGNAGVSVRTANSIYQIAQGPFYPTDASGKNLDEIPFSFFGVENNDEQPDLPPLYDLASLNIAHYRNSADYEESCFIVGQPTPYFSGLTEAWVKDVLKGRIALGSRGAVPLPENATAGLLQAEANTMPKEAMEHKEKQMVALGAKLVESSTTQRTATEAKIDDASETSALVSAAKNVSAAIKFALEWCAVFVGQPENSVDFELHSDFAISRMTAEDRKQAIAEWQAEAITFTEMRNVLRKVGIATEEDDKAKQEIDEAIKLDLENEVNRTTALADANGDTPPTE